MQEYYGSSEHILDPKGRINLPARFRDATERDDKGDLIFIMTKGTDPYIAVFPISEWRNKNNELNVKIQEGKKRRIAKRRINKPVSQQKVDKQGRINIPGELIKYAGLKDKVVVMGTGEKIEIWDPRKLDKNSTEEEPEFEAISDVLDF
jgi:MraZ protein